MKADDHRTRVTKMLIKNSFLKLLTEKPISNITVKELCLDAGINRGTFYNNYRDINDLLMQIETELFQEVERILEPMLTESITSNTITTKIFHLVKEHAELFYVTLSPNGDIDFLQKILNLGKEHAIKSYNRKYYNIPIEKVELHYTFVSAGCVALLQRWLMGSIDMTAEEMSQAIEAMVSNGPEFLFNYKL